MFLVSPITHHAIRNPQYASRIIFRLRSGQAPHASRITFYFATAVLLLLSSACAPEIAPTPVPPTVTSTALVAPVSATRAPTPTLVAFPTVAPPTPTVTLSATLVSPRAASVAPVVQFVTPLTNTQVSLNQTVYIVAYAADDDGIARIELMDDHAPVRAENAPTPPPQTFAALIPWTPTTLGAHVLRVVAYDASNLASVPDEVVVSVIPDARRPTATIVYPLGTPQIELGSVLQLHAVATDEVGIARLDLWVDNQLYTYVTSPNASGQSPLAVVFAWSALTPGTHTLFIRAYDAQNQTTDSAPLKVFVADTHAPTLSVVFNRTHALPNEPITVTITALDVSGIQRIELWTGKEIASTIASGVPARQTFMTARVVWQSGTPGDYQLTARAYNANGNFKEAPVQTISILRPGQSTPTRAPTPTPTRTRAPRATPTARPQPPPPPSADIAQPADRFASPAPLRVVFSGQGHAALERIELWGYYQGQLNPQVICTVDARATTQKSGMCDWSPPNAGAVFLFAQAIDAYRQFGRSKTLSGYIGMPALPGPTPTPVSLTGRWSATTLTEKYSATLRQAGTAIRGELKIVTAGTEIEGRITSGALKGDRLTFRVEFSAPALTATPILGTLTPTTLTPSPAASPTPLAPAMEFDCGVDPSATLLDCTFKDARGRTGAPFFHREGAP